MVVINLLGMINIVNLKKLKKELETYLININKKILIISKNEVQFNNYFISRTEIINNYFLTYFNNDIQYGSKFIIKRVMDILISFVAIFVFTPFALIIYLYIFILDGGPAIIKQNRVGLHGKKFNMYKFRTMKKDAHSLRKDLSQEILPQISTRN